MANPFSAGKVAAGAAFTDREQEIAVLLRDVRAGQDVFIASPRRYGKTSLILEVIRRLRADGVPVAYVDLFTATSVEGLAAALARSYYEGLLTPLERAQHRLGDLFGKLPVLPQITINPADGSTGLTLGPAVRAVDDPATLVDALLQAPADVARKRGRRVAVVLDEFQDVVDLDPTLPRRMRAAFQLQPEVAHVYLGSRRTLMRRLFTDRNEAFYRSAKHVPLGAISADTFAAFIRERFAAAGGSVEEATIQAVLAITGGHPYETQKLCAALWDEAMGDGGRATVAHVEPALASVLASEEHAYTRLWGSLSQSQRLLLQALAREPARSIYSEAYRVRHRLGPASSVQTALKGLEREEIVEPRDGRWSIHETFFREWVRQTFPGL